MTTFPEIPSTTHRARSRRGQAMSEYLILMALISVASISVVQILSRNLRGKLAEVANRLGDVENPTVKGIRAGEETFKVRDLGDFGEGIQNNGSQ